VSRRRLSVLLAVGLTGLVALAGCRTSPSVAAYVGDDRISVDALSAAVDERLADPDIATFAAGDRAAYARQVLSLQVAERVYAAAAARYDVAVSDADVQDRIDTLLSGADEATVFHQLAQQQGITAADVRENIRQQLVRLRAATAAGQADLSDAALQQRYADSRDTLARVQLGIITVPDQATADAVLAQLTADPAGYPALAAQYAGSNTLPAPQAFDAGQLPGVLAGSVAATPPGQGFTQAVPEAGGVVVGFVAGSDVPAFADVRDQLAQEAASEAEAAGATLVGDVRADIPITVNPRYGVLDSGRVVAGNGGVVQLLETAGGVTAGGSGD
jgi:peptidyl-prolyl cis-trans isomerase SurA